MCFCLCMAQAILVASHHPFPSLNNNEEYVMKTNKELKLCPWKLIYMRQNKEESHPLNNELT